MFPSVRIITKLSQSSNMRSCSLEHMMHTLCHFLKLKRLSETVDLTFHTCFDFHSQLVQYLVHQC
ncbi:hypothetical protein B4U80_05431 [Leptotrombidium deliense]|uniref:Uncharacterized protein n=1 Tax=Leptotrombidium deliense TaxID=299467 RepID=A0A443RSH5_9ACAR|nr:hypothetical protein B4U80_05431 [Leptotrombidium deliense]